MPAIRPGWALSNQIHLHENGKFRMEEKAGWVRTSVTGTRWRFRHLKTSLSVWTNEIGPVDDELITQLDGPGSFVWTKLSEMCQESMAKNINQPANIHCP